MVVGESDMMSFLSARKRRDRDALTLALMMKSAATSGRALQEISLTKPGGLAFSRMCTHLPRQRIHEEPALRQLRAFADTQGWTVVHEYVDRASGKRGDREQFQKMFAAASRREFDCLLFWSLDRLSREGTVEIVFHIGARCEQGEHGGLSRSLAGPTAWV